MGLEDDLGGRSYRKTGTQGDGGVIVGAVTGNQDEQRRLGHYLGHLKYSEPVYIKSPIIELFVGKINKNSVFLLLAQIFTQTRNLKSSS
jgi:hypothetical protein